MGQDLLRLGVRYCGGCNPTFDRVAAVERLLRGFGEQVRQLGYREDGIQAILLVCGCPTACPAQEALAGRIPCFILREEGELQEAARWLRELLQELAGMVR